MFAWCGGTLRGEMLLCIFCEMDKGKGDDEAGKGKTCKGQNKGKGDDEAGKGKKSKNKGNNNKGKGNKGKGKGDKGTVILVSVG